MAGAMRKMAVYLGLVEDADADEYAEEEPASTLARSGGERRDRVRHYDEQVTAVRYSGSAPSRDVDEAYRITTLHPRTYNEAKAIGEHFREGTPVIMNLTEMDDSDAKRLVDFSAGLIFGLRGSIERITSKVFLLSPANVDVTAEDKARIAEGGFFNQS
ncbi:MAG: cell division protein SepF [Mycobacteriales bacterium]